MPPATAGAGAGNPAIAKESSDASLGAPLEPWGSAGAGSRRASREDGSPAQGMPTRRESDDALLTGSDSDTPYAHVDAEEDRDADDLEQERIKEGLLGAPIPKPKKKIKVLTVNGAVSRGSYDCLSVAIANTKGVRLLDAPNMLNIEQKDKVPGKVVWAITSDEVALLSAKMKRAQWLARIPGLHAVVRKAPFAEALARWTEHTGQDLPFWPTTWVLPDECDDLRKHMAATKEKETIIYKPSDGSQGDGIYLMRTARDLDSRMTYCSTATAVAQEYIADACLLGGFKFDVRLYVLVTRLEYGVVDAFICDEGLVRMCTTAYEKPTARNLHKMTAHLTNYSLNKTSKDFDLQDDGVGGSKRLWSETVKAMRAEHGEEKMAVMFDRLDAAMRDSLYAVASEFPDIEYSSSDDDDNSSEEPDPPQDPKTMTPQQRLYGSVRSTRQSRVAEAEATQKKRFRQGRHKSFQILGFDVMFTEELQPIVLEVNGNPSMRIDQVVVSNEKIDGRKVCKCMSHHRPHCHLPCNTDTAAKSAAVGGALTIVRRMTFDKLSPEDDLAALLDGVRYKPICWGTMPDAMRAPPNPDSCVLDCIPNLPKHGIRGARTYLRTWTGAPAKNVPRK